ncbi:MAG: hypothetical protein CVV27_00820 [Candidatus Melainabacteria bacterium HGW-Melainabacteria-1]|nr:MAG: hypothetical protein CVV27_00820 [Candidatus Melainabacteria bacterium HGW-Melainabacteria-1]
MPLENSWQAKALAKEYFFPAQRFEVYRNGQSRGVLDIEGFQAAGCSGFGFATGLLRPPLADTQQSERFIAFSQGFPGQRNYAGELPLEASQRALAESMTQANYAERGLSTELLSRLQIDAVQALSLNQGQTQGLMVASRILAGPDSSSGCNSHALLLLLEQSGQGWVPRLELYKTDTQAEGMCSGYSFISSFRTEPASDYLLIEGWGYEWNWYEIYRRTPNGNYHQEFSGGGGGC